MRRNNQMGGVLALAAIGLFVLFRNRDRIRDILERQGIRVPADDELVDRIRVGARRVVGQVKAQAKEQGDILKQVG